MNCTDIDENRSNVLELHMKKKMNANYESYSKLYNYLIFIKLEKIEK